MVYLPSVKMSTGRLSKYNFSLYHIIYGVLFPIILAVIVPFSPNIKY